MATCDDGITRIGRSGDDGGIVAKFRWDDLRRPERDLVELL
jgi:hypothetical protein